MKQTKFRVVRTGDTVICENVKDVQTNEGVQYITVRRPNNPRTFLMRLEALVRVEREK